MHWRRKWQPTPVFLPGQSQGRGSLVGCHLWGPTESDMTEATYQQQQQSTHHVKCRLDESQAGIKIAGRNINNLRTADDTTLMEESEEELKRLLMGVKEKSEKAGLKLSIQKTKIMASSPITSWQIDGERMETVTDSLAKGLQDHCSW